MNEGHGTETECYNKSMAMRVCEQATDCYAIASQNDICSSNGGYRVTHGGPTLLYNGNWGGTSLSLSLSLSLSPSLSPSP